jgi:hypothetical protein
VFQNLVDNALKYAKPATTVTWRARPLGADRLASPSATRANGIPAAHLPRLTERYLPASTPRARALGRHGPASPSSSTSSIATRPARHPERRAGPSSVTFSDHYPAGRPSVSVGPSTDLPPSGPILSLLTSHIS